MKTSVSCLLLPTADFCAPEATTTFSSWLLLLLTVILLNKCLLHNFLISAKLDITYGLSTSKAEDLALVLHPKTHTMLSPPPSSQFRKPSLTQYSEFGLWLCRILYIHFLTCTPFSFSLELRTACFILLGFQGPITNSPPDSDRAGGLPGSLNSGPHFSRHPLSSMDSCPPGLPALHSCPESSSLTLLLAPELSPLCPASQDFFLCFLLSGRRNHLGVSEKGCTKVNCLKPCMSEDAFISTLTPEC